MTTPEQLSSQQLAPQEQPAQTEEAMRLNAYFHGVMDYVYHDAPAPDLGGDRFYDAVWCLRIADEQLGNIRERMQVSPAAHGQGLRLLRLERALDAIDDARRQHPAGGLEGLSEILAEIIEPELPYPRPMNAFGRTALEYAGAADDEDRLVYTNDNMLMG